MRTINAFSEAGVEDVGRGSYPSVLEFEEIGEDVCTQTRPVIDDDALAELIHDIRNTIGAVAMLSELTSLELAENSDLRGMTRNVQEACQDAGGQCEQILAALRGSRAPTELTDLSALIREMSPLLATWMPPASVLRFNLESDLPRTEVKQDEIRRVVMNLVKNAAEAVSDRPGIVTVSTGWIVPGAAGPSESDRSPGAPGVRHVCLAVSDTGCGIDEPTRAGLQTEHYSSKSHGHGLGLASVRRIVAAHGARLRITSRVGAGTTVCVIFAEQATVENDVPLSVHDADEPSVSMEDIRGLPLRPGAGPVHRQSASVRTIRAQRLRLCGAESIAVDAQY
jgi:signal transduction histidine kinase